MKQLDSKDISESLENTCYKLDMAVYSYNPHFQNVEVGESGAQASPKIHSEFKVNLSSIRPLLKQKTCCKAINTGKRLCPDSDTEPSTPLR